MIINQKWTQEIFLDEVRRRVALVAVGASALRNQGRSGLVGDARDYFREKIILNSFFEALTDERSYLKFLDSHTKKLNLIFRNNEEGNYWGAARKALNLFFRDLVYNKFISEQYKLPKSFEEQNNLFSHLEIPLDKYSGQWIQRRSEDVLKWKSIKEIDAEINRCFQLAAKKLADERGVARVHLDLISWRVDEE